ncbi:hypothetical protein Taro_029052 [Colocasia esculenta]|uniref:Phytocyanin domain-containing protein n=1 Tax=Colocasia esculenta TaxID=4460 RepID=A0A843VK77_COLES|nr:hypothetical protein [Colocasia esculenta]
MSTSSFRVARCKAFLFLLVVVLFCAVSALSVSSLDFEVGGEDGWEVPRSNNTQFYNQWASKNRFKVDDILVFKYRKDSVMVVTEEDYGRCNSSHPVFFDNRGSTEVKLDRPGPFYFISGNAGHCQLGQKMIVKVLRDDDGAAGSSPPSAADQTGTTPSGPLHHSGAVAPGCAVSTLFLLLVGPLLF